MGQGRIIAAAILAAAAFALSACGNRAGEGEDCPAGPKPATPSGYCVPRYLSLKRGEVFGRKGPGRDYPAVFVYHARGLPVQVVDETTDWRRICDPDGGLVWVSRAMVDGRRTVFVSGSQAVAVRGSPKDDASVTAYLRPRSIARLTGARGDWRQISIDGAEGWVRTNQVWGLSPAPQCH
jgi:SH3-like domain-containing protein